MPRRCTAALALAMFAGAAWPTCPDDRTEVVAQINRVRAVGGDCGGRGSFPPAPPLAWNDTLARMAGHQAEWLASIGTLRHQGPQGQSVGERARSAGYLFRRVGENLALGQRSLPAALSAWVHSESHCATLFGAEYTEAALACLLARDGRPLWVMALGRPQMLARRPD